MIQIAPLLYFLRVPLFFGLLLAVFAPLALLQKPLGIDNGAVHAMLEGLFDLEAAGVGFATFGTFLATTTCWLTSALVLEYAHLRFRVPGMRGPVRRRRIHFSITLPQTFQPVLQVFSNPRGFMNWLRLSRRDKRLSLYLVTYYRLYRPLKATLWLGGFYIIVACVMLWGIAYGSRASSGVTTMALGMGFVAFLILTFVVLLVRLPRRLYAIVVTLGRALQRVPFLSNVTPFNVIGQLIGQLIGRLRDLVTYLSETALPALLR